MGFGIVPALRIGQAVLAVFGLAMSCYVANWYNVDISAASPSQVNFLIFASIWSLISLAVLEIVPRFAPRASHPYSALAFEFTNVIFWFAGFIAIAVFLSRLLFCRNAVCGVAQADAVISAFQFVIWGVSIFFMAKDVFKGGLRRPAAGRAGQSMKETVA
ncbi:hypothetical protein QBC33DRAFT_510425 [Phialemonium atrogriseum]|uniref:MARVEL domain-containing protein n=1 Tax=Phialemonium atrogriseum TaxID=1093897 RepID=A0AAJ0FRM4_9PEZI|nr:uncharacterized protein QBC33DRAFT_510425 [Phialemonium atrogriseum]KAK1772574.1 hypothetical protein QBC33DRAFT_510425 [Phialemonium atrogriseum]